MRRRKAASPGHPSLHGLRDHDPEARRRATSSRAPPSSAETQPGRTLRPGAEGLGPQAEVGLRENFPTPRGRREHTGRLRGRKRRLFEDRGQEPSPSSSPLFRPESPDRAGTVHSPTGTPPPDGHLLVQLPQRGRREALRSGARRHWRGPRRERSPLPGGTQSRPPEPSVLTTPTSLPAALLGAQRRVPPAPPGGHAPPGRPWSAGCLQTPASGPARGAW